MAETIFGKE